MENNNKEIILGDIVVDEEINIGDIEIDVEKIYPALENIVIKPTTEKQIFNHLDSYGYDEIEIEAVDITQLEDYQTCLELSKQILESMCEEELKNPVADGLLLEKIETMNFDGVDDVYDTGIAQASLTNGYTILMRVKSTEWVNYRGIFGKHGVGGICGFQYEKGTIYYRHWQVEGQQGNAFTLTTEQLSLDNWHILAITFSKTEGVKGYLENTLVGSNENLLDVIPFDNLILGTAYTGSNRFFKGDISHFIVYDRALQETELSSVYEYIVKTTGGVA